MNGVRERGKGNLCALFFLYEERKTERDGFMYKVCPGFLNRIFLYINLGSGISN